MIDISTILPNLHELAWISVALATSVDFGALLHQDETEILCDCL